MRWLLSLRLYVRNLSPRAPNVGLERWNELLKANGFSVVDVSSTPSFCSIIVVAQAVDEMVQILREPLAVSTKALPPCGDILIVGGGASSPIVSKIQEILGASVPSKVVTTRASQRTSRYLKERLYSALAT
jgi:hypothetical protein